MATSFKHFQFERDSRGVAWVTLDVRGSPMNVFSDEVVRELMDVVGLLEAEPPKAAVFRSSKASGFLAGADVKRIQRIPTEEEARAVQAVGQQIFDRIENLSFPTIAAIHGVCLGGGLEFALSCRYRVARNDPQTKIGLPEVQLGLIPGWGGTYRLPKLVGLQTALKIILEGSTLSASKALTSGLIDAALVAETYEADLQKFVEDRLADKPLAKRNRSVVGSLLEGTAPGRMLVMSIAKRKAGSRSRHYPAIGAAFRAIAAGLKGGRAAGLAAERAEFPPLLFGSVSRNLIDLFFRREQARKPSTWASADDEPRKIRKAAVVGAGTMGAGIAQLLAFNGIPVVLKDIDEQIAKSGKAKVEALTADAVAKGAVSRADAAALIEAVSTTSVWDPLSDADLVVEAVVERESIKREVFAQLAKTVGANAVLASNTSALSVSRLGEGLANPGRVAGLHFFNPVHKMQLVEVIRGRTTDDAAIATLVELVRRLGKVPIVVADSPGFLVNRILFPYLDEAVRLTLEGVPGEVVDREAVRFGMPMGPLELLDQVGIDVAADVAKTLEVLRSDPGPTPERLAAAVKAGFVGQKSGRGFYLYKAGKRTKATEWANPAIARKPRRESRADASGLTEIQRRLIYPMINEAAKCLDGVVGEPWAVDVGMVLGTGFAPFRGGPLHVADSIGLPLLVDGFEDLAQSAGTRFEPCPLLKSMAADRREFFPSRSDARWVAQAVS